MAIVANEVAFGLENLRAEPAAIWPRVDAALAEVDATHLRDRRTTSRLSGGELQRVCLASALALEPSSCSSTSRRRSSTPRQRITSWRRRSALGAAVVLSEQRIERALSLATRVLFVEGGRLLLDAPESQAEALARRQPPPIHLADIRRAHRGGASDSLLQSPGSSR